MCKSIAEGGQRCSAHTRPDYDAATLGTAEWDEAAAIHATTVGGYEEIAGMVAVAEANGDEMTAAAGRAALRRGTAQRDATNETVRQIRPLSRKWDPEIVPGGDRVEHRDRIEHRHNGLLHREDGPAIEGQYSSEWYRRGLRHRDGGPAVERTNGSSEYWKNGHRHRSDGPAVIATDGALEYWEDGLLHRDDGPAEVRPSGSTGWYRYGVKHRDDGPAVEMVVAGTNSIHREWWSHGQFVREENVHAADTSAVSA